MRLIDADAFERYLDNHREKYKSDEFKYELMADAVIYDMGKFIVDAVPVRHGRWIHHSEVKNIYGGKCIECSECGEKYVCMHIEDEKYCRNCGAKMDAEREEK